MARPSVLGDSADACGQILDECRDRKNRVISFERELLAREIREHQVGPAESNIDSDGKTILSSNVQERWLAPAHCFARCSFIDHFLIDQFLDQHADHSASDIHSPRQVSARNWLMFPNQVERNPPVDIARSGTRCHSKIPGIYFAHLTLERGPVCLELGQYMDPSFLSTVFCFCLQFFQLIDRAQMVDSSLRCNFEECEPQAPKARNMLARGKPGSPARQPRWGGSAERSEARRPWIDASRPQALKVRNRNPFERTLCRSFRAPFNLLRLPGAARFAIT